MEIGAGAQYSSDLQGVALRSEIGDLKRNEPREIAKTLGNASKWHSHGRGISMRDLEGPDIKLMINNFDSDEDLSAKIKNYHGLTVDYFSNRLRVDGYIHSQNGMRRVL